MSRSNTAIRLGVFLTLTNAFATVSNPASAMECQPYSEGKASWYHLPNRRMANQKMYNTTENIIAHRTLPFDTTVKIVDKETQKSIMAKVKDRGPYAEKKLGPKGKRAADMNKKAAEELGDKKKGLFQVAIYTCN